MKREFLIFVLSLFLGCYIAAVAFGKSDTGENFYTNFTKKELLNDLTCTEKQVFNNTHKSDNITERLERLEVAVFGAIQPGSEDFRIKRLRKSVTNISSGGNGLNRIINSINLAGDKLGSDNLSMGNMHTFSHNNYYNNSRRLPPPRGMYSHRMPPPPKYTNEYNHNPVTTGNYTRDYSIGTSVKILED